MGLQVKMVLYEFYMFWNKAVVDIVIKINPHKLKFFTTLRYTRVEPTLVDARKPICLKMGTRNKATGSRKETLRSHLDGNVCNENEDDFYDTDLEDEGMSLGLRHMSDTHELTAKQK